MHKNKNIIHATNNAINGIKILFKESSVKRELFVILTSIVLFMYYKNYYTLTLLILSFLLIAIESLNTAIEIICDHLTLEIHPEIKKIKDLGAAAVFIISCLVCALFIYCIFLALS